jgi:hypothetical protein
MENLRNYVDRYFETRHLGGEAMPKYMGGEMYAGAVRIQHGSVEEEPYGGINGFPAQRNAVPLK